MLFQTKNPHGGDIYTRKVRLDFSANTNPFGTPDGVLQAISENLGTIHRYPDPGCTALLRALAEHEKVPQEQILCGNGAAELIFSYCEALRAKTAMELAPTFSEYSRAFEHFGGEMLRFSLEKPDFLPGEAFLEKLERLRPEVVFLCNPNNPTGKLLPPEFLGQVLELTGRLGIRLFLDECFLDLTDGGQSLMESVSAYPNLLILKAFTKSYGMAGVRLGCCFCSDSELLKAMSESVQPWNVSALAQVAGIAALGEKAFLEKTRTMIRKQRPIVKKKLEKLGFFVADSSVNFLLFQGPAGLDRKLLEEGIAIRSCANFHGLGEGWYRIAIRTEAENKELMNAVERVMEEREWLKTL